MLTTMRKRVRVVMIIVAVAFVGGFLLGEVWSLVRSRQLGRAGRNPGIVGEVGGHKITPQAFQRAVAYVTQKYREQTGLRDLSAADYEEIENQAWDFTVNEIVWGDLLRKTRVATTEEEVIEIMKANPPEELYNSPNLRDSAGNFDRERYLQSMNNPRNQEYFARYFQQIAEMLPKEKLRIDVANSYRVSGPQAEEGVRMAQSSFRVTSLFFGPAVAGEVAPATEEELRSYYEEHTDEFASKEIRLLKYVMFPVATMAADSTDAEDIINRAHQQLQDGERFNLTVVDFSDLVADTTPALIGRDRLDSATDSVLKLLKPGEHSAPFLSAYGWQIVMLDSTKEDSVAFRRIVVRVKLGSGAVAEARDKARDFLERVASTPFDTVALDMNVAVQQARPLIDGKGSFTALKLTDEDGFVKWAQGAKAGDVLDYPLRAQAGLVVFQVSEVRPAEVAALDNVKQRVEWRVKQAKQRDVWLPLLQEAAAAIRAGQTLEQYAQAHQGVELNTEDFEGIDQAQRQRGPEFAGAVYALDEGETVGPVMLEWGGFILRCDERRDPPPGMGAGFAQQHQQQLVQQALQELIAPRDIKDYRDELYN